MASRSLCDICGKETGDDRIVVSCPTWTELYDICPDCFAKELEGPLTKGMKRQVKRYVPPGKGAPVTAPVHPRPEPTEA